MRIRRLFVFVLALGFLSSVTYQSTFAIEKSQNTFLTLDRLLEACTTPDMSWVDFCNGYMQAVYDFGSYKNTGCVKEGVTRTYLTTLFENRAKRIINSDINKGTANGFEIALYIFENELPCN